MNKRATYRESGGQSLSAALPEILSPSAPNEGLAPYAGPWDWQQAAHLLRRTTFGPTRQEIEWALAEGMDNTIAKLFEEIPPADPPVNHNNENDPNVPIGETWVNAPYAIVDLELPSREDSLKGWLVKLYFNTGLNIREKMSFFWHNHFGVNDISDPKYTYSYFNLIQTMALGNFKDLVKQMTIHPQMLRFLNGNQNTKKAPNENFARELLELYTVGKGPQIAPGDYTHYTEEDIFEISKILTGWKNLGFKSRNANDLIESVFIQADHETGLKILSEKFNNTQFESEGELSYDRLVDVIFEHPMAAVYICRKLYRWFVYYEIDEEAEQNVIQPLAQLLRDNDFEIKPVLIALLSSEHFFRFLSYGPMIKTPLDALVSLYRTLRAIPTFDNVTDEYNVYAKLYQDLTRRLGFDFFNPPEVAGWKAWYQEPVFYRTWINTGTVQVLNGLFGRIFGEGYEVEGIQVKADPISILNEMVLPFDPNYVVEYFTDLLLPMPLSGSKEGGSFVDGQYRALKEQLIPGLPDFEWTVEYDDWQSDPENPEKIGLIETKLMNLLRTIARLAEFHLS